MDVMIFDDVATSFDDVSIISIKVNNYRIHFWYMSKID